MITVNQDFYTLRCINCKTEFDERETCTICLKCKSPLNVEYNYNFIRQRLNLYALKNSPISALKYLTLYPILNLEKIVTLNEGGTPLHRCRNLSKKFGLKNLYIKNEGANPTGVFKDRGTLVEVTKALEMRAKAVCFASTGNMAASVSAYCTLAKIPCYVLVPEGTPIGKLAQTLSYGARIIQVRATYSECATLAEKMAKKYGFYLAGDYAFRLEGQKSLGYEIAEQLGWKAPDYVLCPVGVGTNISAIWKGFVEMKLLGLIDSLPKIIAVQPENCNVVVKAFNSKSKKLIRIDKPDTICSAVAVSMPFDGPKVLKALKDSHGSAVSVSDEEVLMTEQSMAKEEAIFVEPSGALPMAAMAKLTAHKFFKKDDVVICVATGNGLKDPKSAVKIIPEPPTIDPDMHEVDNYLKYKLYQIQSEGIKNKAKILWKKIPAEKDLKKIIHNEFGIEINPQVLKTIIDSIRAFETKGKNIIKQDLQNIIEEQLDEYSSKDKYLEIIDFEAKTSKYKQASASIKIRYGEKILLGQATGVGAVDAIITALKRSIKEHDKMFIRLTDYNVEIFTGGVEAAVKVTMSAVDKNGNKIIAHATSPDVIVASIRAFEKCYNFLYLKNYKHGHK
ncbi:threonine synthase [Candidatus Peregrinibacteria bacterium]|nr:threonine synthase [Candidatus Peregrinibacteria bacterium]